MNAPDNVATRNIVRETRYISELVNDVFEPLPYKPISGDSHVVEPPNLYKDYIDPQFRDQAPEPFIGPKGGAVWPLDGIMGDGIIYNVGVGSISCAGVDPKEMQMNTMTYADMHPGCFDPKARIEAQDRDGLGGEVLYPSIGMVLCNHEDKAFQQASCVAYNRWMEEYQAYAPDRLFGLGQTAAQSVEQLVKDLQDIADRKFCGVMMPMEPGTDFPYDDVRFDPAWEAATVLKLPLTFHIFTSPKESKAIAAQVAGEENKGRNMAFFHHGMIRANQDVISNFVWGRVFERFPTLKLVCAEADAGWAPHFMYRMNHFYRRHGHHSNLGEMAKLPGDYVWDNVWFTFQDDVIAMNSLDRLNPRRLLWSNDFPHSDATWPWSQQLLAEQTRHMTDEQRKWIVRDNHIDCFNLKI